LRKERFPSKRKSKLMPRSDGPFEIIEKVGPNAYEVDLPCDHGVSTTFYVSDLSPYFEDEPLPSLTTNSHSLGRMMETINPTLLRSFLSPKKTLLSSRRSRKWLNFAEQSWQCPMSWRQIPSIITQFLLLVLCKIWWTNGLRAHIIFYPKMSAF